VPPKVTLQNEQRLLQALKTPLACPHPTRPSADFGIVGGGGGNIRGKLSALSPQRRETHQRRARQTESRAHLNGKISTGLRPRVCCWLHALASSLPLRSETRAFYSGAYQF